MTNCNVSSIQIPHLVPDTKFKLTFRLFGKTPKVQRLIKLLDVVITAEYRRWAFIIFWDKNFPEIEARKLINCWHLQSFFLLKEMLLQQIFWQNLEFICVFSLVIRTKIFSRLPFYKISISNVYHRRFNKKKKKTFDEATKRFSIRNQITA